MLLLAGYIILHERYFDYETGSGIAKEATPDNRNGCPPNSYFVQSRAGHTHLETARLPDRIWRVLMCRNSQNRYDLQIQDMSHIQHRHATSGWTYSGRTVFNS